MRRRLAKIVVLSLLAVSVVIAVLAGTLFWTLTQGPVSLSGLSPRIESAINSQLEKVRIKLGAAVLELEPDTYVPKLRFVNMTVTDAEGKLVASAPKVAITLDTASLMTGRIVPVDVELIGPSIRGQRSIDGAFELGVVGEALPETEAVDISDLSEEDTGKSGLGTEAPVAEPSSPNIVPQLLQFFADGQSGGTLSSVNEIRISRARVTLYDEANSATWFAPRSDLSFRRMPFGFVVFATADVASTGEPWRAEVSATYRKDSKRLAVSTRVDNVVPANVAQQIYALSQFAKAKLPLAGVVELEFDSNGSVTRGDTQLTAGVGTLEFPDYFSQIVKVEGGNLNMNYDVGRQLFDIANSKIVIGGAAVDLKGQVTPNWTADGKVASYGIKLTAHNPAGTSRNEKGEELFIDSVDFLGKALLEEQQLDIDDLIVRAGGTGLRINGSITAGTESAGIVLAGRLKNLAAPIVKRMWPPIMAPNTFRWINANIASGRIADGTFHINFRQDELSAALRNNRLPQGSVNVQVGLQDVQSKYFKNLQPLESASGALELVDNDLTLRITGGDIRLSGIEPMLLKSGTFTAKDVLAQEVRGAIAVSVEGSIQTTFAFLQQQDLAPFVPAKMDLPPISGTAHVNVELSLPLVRDVPRERVNLKTSLALSGVRMDNLVSGIDLTDGKLAVDYAGDVIDVRGPAKLNGLGVNVIWRKPKSGGAAVSGIETTLDSATLGKLGGGLEKYIKGSVPVKIALQQNGTEMRADVQANLSKVSLSMPTMGWSRDQSPGTKASFTVLAGKDGTRRIENLELVGDGLEIFGSVGLAANGKLQSAKLKNVVLGEQKYRSLVITPVGEGFKLTVDGDSLDARPFISRLTSPASAKDTQGSSQGGAFDISATFDKVHAYRGEIVQNVTARVVTQAGKVTNLEADGQFVNGLPIKISITSVDGNREMRVFSNDGGSTLRAANFYSKVAGGQLQFYALIASAPGSPIRKGQLEIKSFEVRNEAALADLDKRGKPKKSGPRRDGISFKRLTIPFTTDERYVYLPGVELKGADMGAVAKGDIRKADGALRITGTYIPAQGITGFLDDVPLIGLLVTGGNNEGIFGITFAMDGTMSKPRYHINPISALAPGFLRKFFEFQAPKKKTTSPY